MEAGQRRSHDEKNLCFAHWRGNCAWMACNRTRRQRAWAVFRPIRLLLWGPVIRLLLWRPVVRSEPDVCPGSTRAAEIQQSRPPRFPGRVTRLSAKVSMRRVALAARRLLFSAHEVGRGLIVGVSNSNHQRPTASEDTGKRQCQGSMSEAPMAQF